MHNKEVLSKFLHDYFINLDDPPATELLVPVDNIEIDEDDHDLVRATLIYHFKGMKPHKVKIEFNAANLDAENFDVQYEYINDY